MASSSKTGIGCMCFVSMLLSMVVIGTGIWLALDNSCVKILHWPVIIIGVAIMVVSMAGSIGLFWRIPRLLNFYHVAMLVAILLLACLVVFIFVFIYIVIGRAYLEYETLDDFLQWLPRAVRSIFKWDRIRSCLNSSSMCADLGQHYRIAQDFFNAHITPLQSGCCKPPTNCGYTYVGPTYWISPKDTAADMDCLQWNNNQTQLCYSCDSCKAGLLGTLRKEWRKADIVLFIILVALIFVYFVGCCAFRNAKTEELSGKQKQGDA